MREKLLIKLLSLSLFIEKYLIKQRLLYEQKSESAKVNKNGELQLKLIQILSDVSVNVDNAISLMENHQLESD